MTLEIRILETAGRDALKSLLNASDPKHAMAAFYSIEQDPSRAKVAVAYDGGEYPIGLSVSSQTGMDLFRRVVTVVAHDRSILRRLLRAVIIPGRADILYLPKDQQSWLGADIELSNVLSTEILQLSERHFQPVVNVLVVEQTTPDGSPRYEIKSQQNSHAAAGVNWAGAKTAEIYLEASAAARERGLSRSVLAALSGRLLGENISPIIRVEEGDPSTKMDAQRVGFRPTGVRELVANATLHSGVHEKDSI